LLYFTTFICFYAAICTHPGVCDVFITFQLGLLNVAVPPTNVKTPLGGVITLPVSTVGAMPVNVTVPTFGVTTYPPTTTLGDDPIITDPPDGVTISPVTADGAEPTNVNIPVSGVLNKLFCCTISGAVPCRFNVPVTSGITAPLTNIGAFLEQPHCLHQVLLLRHLLQKALHLLIITLLHLV
jgi:hypothetical protein